MTIPFDTTAVVIVSALVGIVFNAGISWATMRQLRKDMNGYKISFQSHEKWAHDQVKDFSDRVAHLEGQTQ